MTTPELLSRFERVRQNGAGWSARCPSHDDRTPSLTISVGKNGDTVLHCHAGCEVESIVSAVGLTMADLFNGPKTNGRATPQYVLEATYYYHRADGSLAYRVQRKANPSNPKDKQYPQNPSDGNGGWIKGAGCMEGIERILYRLPELLAADPSEPVFICEGEKCVDAVCELGLVATCNSGGAGKFGKGSGPDYLEPLKGHPLVILADSDLPDPKRENRRTGYDHSQDVAAKVKGIASSVKTFELPGVSPDGGDVFDWIEAGGTGEQLLDLAEAAPEWTPSTSQVEDLFCTAAEVNAMPIVQTDWLATGYFAPGVTTEIIAKIKDGKTTLVLDFVRACVEGSDFLKREISPCGVVYLSEQLPRSFSAQLRHAGIDSNQVFVLFHHKVKQITFESIIQIAVEKALAVGAKVLVIDTFGRFAGFDGDGENSAGDGQARMQSLNAAAARGLAVLSVRHGRKSGGDVNDAGRGSSAISGAADICLHLRRPDGNQAPSIRELLALSRFEETPDRVMIEHVNGSFLLHGDVSTFKHDQTKATILDVLPTNDHDALAVDAIMDKTSAGRGTVQRVLGELLGAKEIDRIGSGKRGDKIRYFLSAQRVAGLGSNSDEAESIVSAHPIEKMFGQKETAQASRDSEYRVQSRLEQQGTTEKVSAQKHALIGGQKETTATLEQPANSGIGRGLL